MENTGWTKQYPPISPEHRHIRVDEIQGVVVIRFINLKRDLEHVDSLQVIGDEFRRLAGQNKGRSVVLDLEGHDISATEVFFALLVRLFREVKQVQGTLKLCNLYQPVVDEMKRIRLNRTFTICESLDDALVGTMPEEKLRRG